MSARRVFWTIATPFVSIANRAGWCGYEWVNVCHGARHRDRFSALWQHQRYGAPIDTMPDFVALCGSGFNVSSSEGLVIFAEAHTLGGLEPRRVMFSRDPYSQLAMVWDVELRGCLSAQRVVEAYGWVKAVYGGAFEKRGPA